MLDDAIRNDRNELIDAYLEAVDGEEYDAFHEIFTDDVTYVVNAETFDGVDAVKEWYEYRFAMDNVYHEYDRRLHDEPASVAFGEFGGELPGGDEMSGGGLNRFEFTHDNATISKAVVYTTLPPRV